jgi:hypothetical protein
MLFVRCLKVCLGIYYVLPQKVSNRPYRGRAFTPAAHLREKLRFVGKGNPFCITSRLAPWNESGVRYSAKEC